MLIDMIDIYECVIINQSIAFYPWLPKSQVSGNRGSLGAPIPVYHMIWEYLEIRRYGELSQNPGETRMCPTKIAG